MNYLVSLILCLYLALPMQSHAVEIVVKDPLNYPLKQYFFILALSVLGGLVGWYGKVRKGEVAATSLSALIGELATSALSGLLTFWVCEWANLQPVLTAAVVGVAGHMGARALTLGEESLKRWADARASRS